MLTITTDPNIQVVIINSLSGFLMLLFSLIALTLIIYFNVRYQRRKQTHQIGDLEILLIMASIFLCVAMFVAIFKNLTSIMLVHVAISKTS